MSKQPPPAPPASAVGPCPTLIQISRTPRHWKFTQHHRTTRPPPPGGGCFDIFTLIYPFSSLSPFLWETARYRLKYCLIGPLNPKQPTNQHPLSQRREKVKMAELLPTKSVAVHLSHRLNKHGISCSKHR